MTILMYHRVTEDGPPGLERWRVSPAEFAKQMAYLKGAGFTSIGLDDWLNTQRRDPASLGQRVVLTFDDADEDFITTAFPVLRQHGFGATIFVPTKFVGGRAEWDAEFGNPAPLLSWDELSALADLGLEIGAHTISHPHLTWLTDEEEIRREVRDSRLVLEDKFGRPVTTFAYPYGDHNEVVREAVKAAGYTLAVTIDPESAGHFALGRQGVFGGEPLEVFVEKLRGQASLSPDPSML
jgi:peptidoglycan/xylan/chitin deacetylase (PgdA/CDA1 family)